MTNLDSIFKSRDITLPTKVRLVKAMVFLFFFLAIDVINFILFLELYIIVLVLPNIKMNLPQVYMCSPS